MIDAACEGCRLESALLLRLCHAGGCSSIRPPLPLWHGNVPTGMEHQHAAAAAVDLVAVAAAKRPLAWALGAHSGPCSGGMGRLP